MKTILVTGANRGLGFEFVLQFLEAGHKVYATCREPKEAEALQSLATEWRGQLVFLRLVVDDESSLEELAGFLANEAAHFDLIINNAGVGGDAFGGEPTVDEMMGVYRVNTVSPLMVTRAVYPYVKKGTGAVIANMSSLLGSLEHKFILEKGGYAYSASKAALNMVTRQMALDYSVDGVIAIALSPGWVKTDMGGDEAPLTPRESIAGMIRVIEKVTSADNGTFWHFDESPLPW